MQFLTESISEFFCVWERYTPFHSEMRQSLRSHYVCSTNVWLSQFDFFFFLYAAGSLLLPHTILWRSNYIKSNNSLHIENSIHTASQIRSCCLPQRARVWGCNFEICYEKVIRFCFKFLGNKFPCWCFRIDESSLSFNQDSRLIALAYGSLFLW